MDLIAIDLSYFGIIEKLQTRDSPFTSSSSLEFLDLRLSDPLSLPSAAFVLLSATDSLVRGDGRNKEQPCEFCIFILVSIHRYLFNPFLLQTFLLWKFSTSSLVASFQS